jgi:hypothetical protein
MKAYGGVDVQIHIFLTSALAGGEWSVSRPGRFTPIPIGHEEKTKFLTLPGLELRPLGRPTSSQSLYGLRYPSSCIDSTFRNITIGQLAKSPLLQVQGRCWKTDRFILVIYRCPRRNVPDFRRVFLMLKYTEITQNTYVQS